MINKFRFTFFMCNSLLLCFLLSVAIPIKAQTAWTSKYVRFDKSGVLQYTPDSFGNILPDFSKVGYYQCIKPIPNITVVKTLYPSGENSQQTIQAAIDEVANMPLDKNGFRGAILLKKGVYKIPASIRIAASGIVLRGEGAETILLATGKGQRNLVNITGEGSIKEIEGTRRRLTQTYVPVGATSFRVASTKDLRIGDKIIVYRPATAKWIHDIKMDDIMPLDSNTRQWTPADYNLAYERQITAVNGDRITIDNPIVMAMEEKYGGGFIYKYAFEGRIQHAGIENLFCDTEFDGATDEDHAWTAVYFNRVENAWAQNISAKHFGYACISLGYQSKNCTVANCSSLDPVSKITGSRRYSFNNDGQLNLVMNCFASHGRHDYVTGAKVCGPNVFYNCRAENAHADIGPHHRWTTGTLYDNIVTDGEINVQDRGNWGTGHGWAGVNQVLWNCKAAGAAIQNPWFSGKNWVIGLQAEKNEGRLKGRPAADWEGSHSPGLEPASLFLAQLQAAGKLQNLPLSAMPLGAAIKKIGSTLSQQVLKDAQWAMQQPIETITAFPAKRSAGGIHDFYSEGDYWWPDPAQPDSPYIQRDGVTNPDNFTRHREAMIRFSRVVGALASAYKLTGDTSYVRRIILHCKAWFMDDATMMYPALLYAQAIKGRVTGRGIGIIDTIHLIEVVKALLAIQQAALLDEETSAGCQSWFKQYLHWLITHPYGQDEMNAKNNHGTCWVMQVAVFAKFTGDTAVQHFCRDRFQQVLLPAQMAADGSFPLELKRTKPYGYSIFNLDAMATICQTLSTPADDLWQYTLPDGRSMKKGIAFLYPYLKDKNTWPYKKDVMYWNNWPVAQTALLFGSLAYNNLDWLNLWTSLPHDPTEDEVIRNLPVRNPLLWIE